jgi:hypothetical protein
VRNESIVTETVATEIELWLAHETTSCAPWRSGRDAGGDRGVDQGVTFEGTVLTVTGEHVTRSSAPAGRPSCAGSACARCATRACASTACGRGRTRTRLSE